MLTPKNLLFKIGHGKNVSQSDFDKCCKYLLARSYKDAAKYTGNIIDCIDKLSQPTLDKYMGMFTRAGQRTKLTEKMLDGLLEKALKWARRKGVKGEICA